MKTAEIKAAIEKREFRRKKMDGDDSDVNRVLFAKACEQAERAEAAVIAQYLAASRFKATIPFVSSMMDRIPETEERIPNLHDDDWLAIAQAVIDQLFEEVEK